MLSREKAREKIKLHFTLHFKKSSTSHFIYRKDCQRVTKIFPENCPKKVFSSPKRQKSRARVIKPSNDTSLSIPQHETQIFFHARPLSKAQSEQADHIKYFSLHENIFSCLWAVAELTSQFKSSPLWSWISSLFRRKKGITYLESELRSG